MVGTKVDNETQPFDASELLQTRSFLVHQPGAAPQVASVRSDRITIGSDPDCHLRLLDVAVARFHAVIVAGEFRTVVRSQAEGVLLNGAPLSEAELQPGDLLQVGSSQIVYLAQNQQTPAASPAGESALSQQAWEEFENRFEETYEAFEARFDSLQQVIDSLGEQGEAVRDAQSASQQQLGQLSETYATRLRTIDDQLDALKNQYHAHLRSADTLSRRQENIESRMAQFVSAAGNRFRAIATREQQSLQSQQEVTARWQELQTQLAELAQNVDNSEGLSLLRAELTQAIEAAEARQQELQEKVQSWLESTEHRLQSADDLANRLEAEFARVRDEQGHLQDEVRSLQSSPSDPFAGGDALAELENGTRERHEQLAAQLSGLQDRLEQLARSQSTSQESVNAVQEHLDELRSKIAMDKFHTQRRIVQLEGSRADTNAADAPRSVTVDQREVADLAGTTPKQPRSEGDSHDELRQEDVAQAELTHEELAQDELSQETLNFANGETQQQEPEANLESGDAFDLDETAEFETLSSEQGLGNLEFAAEQFDQFGEQQFGQQQSEAEQFEAEQFAAAGTDSPEFADEADDLSDTSEYLPQQQNENAQAGLAGDELTGHQSQAEDTQKNEDNPFGYGLADGLETGDDADPFGKADPFAQHTQTEPEATRHDATSSEDENAGGGFAYKQAPETLPFDRHSLLGDDFDAEDHVENEAHTYDETNSFNDADGALNADNSAQEPTETDFQPTESRGYLEEILRKYAPENREQGEESAPPARLSFGQHADDNPAYQSQTEGETAAAESTNELAQVFMTGGDAEAITDTNESAFHDDGQDENVQVDDAQAESEDGARLEMADESAGESETENSIEDYMAQLMQRVRGMTEANDAAASAPAPDATASRAARREAMAAAAAAEAEEKAEAPVTPRAPRERVAPPEQSSLAAMRDLANMSTRGALARHTLNQKVNSVQLKLIFGVAALVASLVLLWFSQTSGNTFAYVGSVASMLIAIYFGVRYLMLTGQLFDDKTAQPQASQKKTEDAEQAAE